MLDTPQIIPTIAQPSAVIHLTIPREEIRNVMGPGLQELMATAAAQGVEIVGPWFTHHLKMVPDVFDFEICVPVNALVVSAGRVRPGQWPPMKVARTVYYGSYEGLSEAWGEFMDWIEKEGYTPAGDLWERYLAGPESGSDAAQWKTELSRPLIG